MRIVLLPDQLERIAGLRRSHASWMAIQRETGVPRRAAKRAYEEWERHRDREELKAARREVAMEEFRQHLDSVVKLAQALVHSLKARPSKADIGTSAGQFLDKLLASDILGEHSNLGFPSGREERQIAYENRLLFKCLQDHAQGTPRCWEVLKAWMEAWDRCLYGLGELQKETVQVLWNFLRQEQGLVDRIKKQSKEENPIPRLEAMWVDVLLESALGHNQPHRDWVRLKTKSRPESRPEYRLDTIRGILVTLTDQGLGGDLARKLNQAGNTTFMGQQWDVIESIRKDLTIIEKAAEELEQLWNPIRLRPVILGTRCELCPA